MTINDLFQYTQEHPANFLFYFCLIPFAALLAGFMEREEGHLPPWNYLYSTLVYLVAVPAILAVAYTIYLWLFERKPIGDTNLLLQFLPIASMLLTFFIVKRQVRIDSLPGFSRLGGLVTMISAALAIMWFMDKVRIYTFTHLPIQWLLGIFVVLLIVIRFAWTRVAK